MSETIDPWRKFKNIVEYEFTTGIENVEESDNSDSFEYYNLDGIRYNSNQLTKGLYIRKKGTFIDKIIVR